MSCMKIKISDSVKYKYGFDNQQIAKYCYQLIMYFKTR